MNLADYFIEVAVGYDRNDGLNTPTQARLTQAASHLAEHVPGGIVVQGSGGKGVATLTPWIGWFDPDETTSPQRGTYLVYLFSEDMETLTLTLNQGMEVLRREHGDREARRLLARDAVAIRSALPEPSLVGWSPTIDLRSSGARQRAYQSGNIAGRSYALGDLPGETVLRAHLSEGLALYELARTAKTRLLLTRPGAIASPSEAHDQSRTDPLVGFKPKSDDDYIAHLSGQRLVKSRRHERLVLDFGRYSQRRGFTPSTEHPRDLVLRRNGTCILVEAKVVYQGNATEAVRAAVGQLFTYSYFLYAHETPPSLVALFSEAVGDAYVEFLQSLGISTLWPDEGAWRGSATAVELGLTD